MKKYLIVLDVCQTKSISRTAEHLNYTQSAVSQAVKSFETELGFPMFKRSKTGMELLPNMEEIVNSLQIICDEYNRITEIARNINSLDSGYIRIGSIQSISYHWLPDVLKRFSETYPNIIFQLTVGGFSFLKEQLKNNKLDCIFVSSYSVPELSFVPIANDELMLVTPKEHALAKAEKVTLSDVNGQDFVLSSDGLDYEMGKIFEMNNIKPKIRYRLDEDYAVLKMVEQGFGITILPKLLIDKAPFEICARSFEEHYSRVLGVAYAKDGLPNLPTIKFLDYVKKWKQKG